ncbi:MAG: hypothetical protein WC645_01380 [Candidatus Margulisiibacteriota bacterium]
MPKRQGRVLFNPAIWQKFSPADKHRILDLIANPDPALSSGSQRTHVLVLDKPIMDRGVRLSALRLKGCFPKIEEGKRIELHQGDGYVQYPLCTRKNGKIYREGESWGAPEMGAFARQAWREFKVALALGPEITDHAVAYGTFGGVVAKVRGQLGFTIFGQETVRDMRLDNYLPVLTGLMPRAWDGERILAAAKEQALQIGEIGAVIRRFHRSYVHLYLHSGNVGVVPRRSGPPKFIIRDLESALPLASLSREQRFTYLLRDIFRLACRLYEEGNDWGTYLLSGYFQHIFPGSFPFEMGETLVKMYESIIEDVSDEEYRITRSMKEELALKATGGYEDAGLCRFLLHYFKVVSSDRNLGVYPPLQPGASAYPWDQDTARPRIKSALSA